MLAQFYDEVLFYGPTAVLPQNLSSKWLRRLQEISDDFLDSNFRLDECKKPEDIGNPILTACVYAILRYQHGDEINITPKEMAERIVIYVLSIIMEAVNRESDIGLE